MRLEIPELSVIALVGVSSSGKSTFAKTHFKPTEILSSDYFRAMISDDENNQMVSGEAFDSLYYIANKRLNLGRLTVIDATNIQLESRKRVVNLAKEHNCLAVAIVLDTPEDICHERNNQHTDRSFGNNIITRQKRQLNIKHIKKEGFHSVYILDNIEDIEIVRVPLFTNKRHEAGPFDIIGDIHGCYNELCELINKLGYPRNDRKLIFLGDLCDRGPNNMEVLRLVMDMVKSGNAYCVQGNHDSKLLRYIKGSNVQLSHGLQITTEQLQTKSEEFIKETKIFLDSLISHYIFDNGRLAVAHAGIIEKYQGRGSNRVRSFCLYGDTTGETDEYGLPVRLPWANEYRGKALVVYGHTPTLEAEIINNTICIDTGCVFGGKLTAYRYPEGEIISIKAEREYYPPAKPLYVQDDMLDIKDIIGTKHIRTAGKTIKIDEKYTSSALETISRFTIDPHWLIYLPPTMSPCETSSLPNYLEYPTEAFEYYKKNGVKKIICQEKHMGSRAVIVLCKDEETARRRFKAQSGIGVIYTRTGRSFFNDKETEIKLLSHLQIVLTDFWEEFQTDWVCLDVEIMPWSAKAQALLIEQYAPVGLAGREGLLTAVNAITQSPVYNNPLLIELTDYYKNRVESLELYTKAYRRYCWDIANINDYKIAPFHILATEGKVWNSENHSNHMNIIKKYVDNDPIFIATNHMLVDLLDEESIKTVSKWWLDLTEKGGEGMVVKPFDFMIKRLQPAIKCRGREYLRIIYGPEYTLQLERLKNRSLSKKRSLALNEFYLGMESLERFVKYDSPSRVHEAVFGVLALESEPIDPRL